MVDKIDNIYVKISLKHLQEYEVFQYVSCVFPHNNINDKDSFTCPIISFTFLSICRMLKFVKEQKNIFLMIRPSIIFFLLDFFDSIYNGEYETIEKNKFFSIFLCTKI